MDALNIEVRFEQDETRQSPGRLTGTLLTYETRAGDRPEVFESGALQWPDGGIVINEQHNRQAPIVRAIPFVDGNEVKVDAPLPNTQRGRDAAENVREGVLTGLSIEFRAVKQVWRGNLRVIQQAVLGAAGLVDKASYTDSAVEVREKSTNTKPKAALLWL